MPLPGSAQRLQQENASNKVPLARTEPQNRAEGTDMVDKAKPAVELDAEARAINAEP